MSVHPQILQLDKAGEPMRWITYEDAAYYYAKGLIAWSIGEDGFTIWGGRSRLTGDRSFMDMNTIIAIDGDIRSNHLHRTPNLTNRALFRRDHNLCAYCGETFKVLDLTREHVVPISKGGPDKWTNVVTSCGGCNKLKDDRTPQDAGMKLLYVPYAPNRAEHLILMNREILADQMEFLMARVTPNSRLRNPPKKH
jgi:hypothetical protein